MALQLRASAPRKATMQKNVNDWERVLSVAAGAALVALAIHRRRVGQGLTGASLIARGAMGYCPVNAALGRTRLRDDTRLALSGPRGIRLEDQVIIRRPVEDVYAFWRDLSNLPTVLTHLERVEEIDDTHSHWVITGPGGVTLEWDAAIINDRPPKLLAWKSLAGADVASAGSVRLRPTRSGTDLTITLQYYPPAGKLGAVLAWLAGQSPQWQLHEDLRRVKKLLESKSYWQQLRRRVAAPATVEASAVL
jgi:uncharacterized membrane protein